MKKRYKRRKKRFMRCILMIILIAILIITAIFCAFCVRFLYENVYNKADVVLDAGHGGKDPGAMNADVYEKDITLSIAKMVKDILESNDYRVAMTRSDDSFLNLKERAVFANKKKPTVFVSIHCNSSEDGQGRGIETFYTEQKGIENQLLAEQIQNALIESTNANDREIKTANYTVLVRTTMPAVLIETGFMSNNEECKLLTNLEYQEKMAQGIGDGIMNYLESIEE